MMVCGALITLDAVKFFIVTFYVAPTTAPPVFSNLAQLAYGALMAERGRLCFPRHPELSIISKLSRCLIEFARYDLAIAPRNSKNGYVTVLLLFLPIVEELP
jgi:hypothetical protein